VNANEFKATRQKLGLTQRELADVLGYASALTISSMERSALRRKVPFHVHLLMQAMDQGFRPESWPKEVSGRVGKR